MSLKGSREPVYDAAVIGAGPAGTSATCILRNAGLRVVLADKSNFPRDKPCGNLISGFAQKILSESIPREIVIGEAHTACIDYGYNVLVNLNDPFAVFVRRSDFDHFLLSRALGSNVTWMPEADASEITAVGNKFKIRFRDGRTITAYHVIGADGATGISHRYVRGRTYRSWEQGFALVTSVPRSACLPSFVASNGTINLDLKHGLGGYGWVFPEGDMLNIGFGCIRSRAKRIRSKLDTFLADILIEPMPDGITVRAHSLPAGGIPRRVAKGRVLLAGDAAGVIDPISGEGIGFSLLSGHLAAKSIINSLQDGDDPSVAYSRMFKLQITSQLRPLLVYASAIIACNPIFSRLQPEFASRLFELQFSAVRGDITHREFVTKASRSIPFLWLSQFGKALHS